jgi:hypothetical protein
VVRFTKFAQIYHGTHTDHLHVLFLTWSNVTTCFFPSLVHNGIMPSFRAIRPTLEEPGNQNQVNTN